MKHIITFMTLAIVLGTLAPLSAQEKTGEKEKRKTTRQERKIARQKEQERLHREAVDALEKNDFVLEADHLFFKRGRSISVSPSTNFISMKNKQAVIQVTFNTPRPLQNGLGGFTVEGKVSDIRVKKDKNENIIYSFFVQGIGISAYVNLSLPAGGNRASATIMPSFHSNTLTMNGRLLTREKSRIFEGVKR